MVQEAISKEKYGLRRTVAQILDVNGDHRFSKIVDVFLIVLISANVTAIILESIPEVGLRYGTLLARFELVSVIIFTIEYALRVWTCLDLVDARGEARFQSKSAYLFSPMALIDLVAIAPFYLAFIFNIDLRFLRVVRLLRVFKLTRYSGAMGLVLDVFREEAKSFIAAFFVLMVLLILASSGIYLLEHRIQPDAFGSIPAAMWWAMASLTTVGYGDVVPVTSPGKFFGGLITVIGMGMVALPAGILASGFADQVHKRRSLYDEKLSEVLQDGEISEDEEAALKRLQDNLGLSRDDVEKLTKQHLKRLYRGTATCPHCKMPLSMEAIMEANEKEDSY